MRPSNQSNQFANVLERTRVVLEAENAALRERRTLGFDEFHARKAMALFELERQGAPTAELSEAMRPGMDRLRELLAENKSLLGLHIRALDEIIEALRAHQVGAESDGTYSPRTIRGGNW
jgi:hypothetical protein